MKTINPTSTSLQEIVVARCENLAEAQAMAHWVLPGLQEWPHPAWHVWLVDATDCGAIKAAKLTPNGDLLDWQGIVHDVSELPDSLCSLLGSHVGLVVLAHHLIASTAARSLEGLVSQMTSFAATDPLAKPFSKSFAAFGVKLAA
jgi:hypothetical protein